MWVCSMACLVTFAEFSGRLHLSIHPALSNVLAEKRGYKRRMHDPTVPQGLMGSSGRITRHLGESPATVFVQTPTPTMDHVHTGVTG